MQKNKDVLSFATAWMEREYLLSKTNQVQKDKCYLSPRVDLVEAEGGGVVTEAGAGGSGRKGTVIKDTDSKLYWKIHGLFFDIYSGQCHCNSVTHLEIAEDKHRCPYYKVFRK